MLQLELVVLHQFILLASLLILVPSLVLVSIHDIFGNVIHFVLDGSVHCFNVIVGKAKFLDGLVREEILI